MLVHDCSGLPFEVLPCIYGAKKKKQKKKAEDGFSAGTCNH